MHYKLTGKLWRKRPLDRHGCS